MKNLTQAVSVWAVLTVSITAMDMPRITAFHDAWYFSMCNYYFLHRPNAHAPFVECVFAGPMNVQPMRDNFTCMYWSLGIYCMTYFPAEPGGIILPLGDLMRGPQKGEPQRYFSPPPEEY